MFWKRRCWLTIVCVAALVAGAYAYYTLSEGRAKSLGQPIAATVVIQESARAETISISGDSAAVFLQSLFYPTIYERPAAASVPTENAVSVFTFEYASGQFHEIHVTARDSQDEWYYGAGKFRVSGDLELALAMLPFVQAQDELSSAFTRAEQERAQRWLTEHTDEYIDGLLSLMNSENETQQARAIGWLHLPQRHPRLPEVREAALRVLKAALREHHAAIDDLESTESHRQRGLGAFILLCGLMQEIADTEATSELVVTLSVTDSLHYLRPLIGAIESLYGLPPFIEPGPLICGTGTSAKRLRELWSVRHARLRAGRDRLLDWLEKYADASRETRLQAVVDAWELHLSDTKLNWRHPYSRPSIRSLLKLGPALRPLLESKRDSLTALLPKARFAVLAACMGSEVDEKLVEHLLKQPGEAHYLACDLIALSGTKRFDNEIWKGGSANIVEQSRRSLQTLRETTKRSMQ